MMEKVLTCLTKECENYLMPFVPPEEKVLKIPCPKCERDLMVRSRAQIAKLEANAQD